MKPLLDKDRKYLLDVTGLPEKDLNNLIEDDLDILLESISKKEITVLVTDISFELFSRLSILSLTDDRDYSLNEKFYVADSVSNIYPKMHTQSYYYMDNLIMNESKARFYLILVSMFEDRIKAQKNFYIELSRDTFKKEGKEEIAEHFFDWIGVLKTLKKSCWK
jgi:hypothetical protein